MKRGRNSRARPLAVSWDDGQRHGQGRFAWADGQVYEGEWVQDRAQGRGKMKFANGEAAARRRPPALSAAENGLAD
ncbi:hypothetical protein [Azohydromonas lata]|uniref:hypothetical protein n=1 Tax=Azohydromonas lata TaxID=45677 RepID=UPI003898FBF9